MAGNCWKRRENCDEDYDERIIMENMMRIVMKITMRNMIKIMMKIMIRELL